MPLPKPGKGERVPGSGRKKGTPNRVTGAMREMWLEAFERAGGVEYLVEQATAQPATFMQGLLRMIPNEVAAKFEAEIKLRVIDHSDSRRGRDGEAE